MSLYLKSPGAHGYTAVLREYIRMENWAPNQKSLPPQKMSIAVRESASLLSVRSLALVAVFIRPTARRERERQLPSLDFQFQDASRPRSYPCFNVNVLDPNNTLASLSSSDVQE